MDGYTGTRLEGIYPDSGADPISALVDVADDAQDTLMHALFAAWPVCPLHHRGAHAQDHEDAAVWWCSGGGGHAVTAIGEWQGRQPPTRINPTRSGLVMPLLPPRPMPPELLTLHCKPGQYRSADSN